jgi:hypothetical protein
METDDFEKEGMVGSTVFQDWITRAFVFVGSSLILSLFFLPASLQ